MAPRTRDSLPQSHPGLRRVAAVLAVASCLVTLAACSHAIPDGSERRGTSGANDDPWIIRGSVSAGPMHGTPPGPYSPR